MKTIVVRLHAGPSGFTDDKDEAKRIRNDIIMPALEGNARIVLDFIEVKSSTQSFVHALLGEVLKRFRDSVLDRIEFQNCSPLMKSLVELVVDYSLGGFQKTEKQQPDSGVQQRKAATKN